MHLSDYLMLHKMAVVTGMREKVTYLCFGRPCRVTLCW